MTTGTQQQQEHKKLSINPQSIHFMHAQDAPQQLTAQDQNGATLNTGVHYSSENAGVASVDPHGRVTPHSKGHTKINAVLESNPDAKETVEVSVAN